MSKAILTRHGDGGGVAHAAKFKSPNAYRNLIECPEMLRRAPCRVVVRFCSLARERWIFEERCVKKVQTRLQ